VLLDNPLILYIIWESHPKELRAHVTLRQRDPTEVHFRPLSGSGFEIELGRRAVDCCRFGASVGGHKYRIGAWINQKRSEGLHELRGFPLMTARDTTARDAAAQLGSRPI